MPIPVAEHWAEPAGACAITTASLAEAEDALAGIVSRRLIGSFTGPAGAGKTFAMQTLLSGRDDINGFYGEVPSDPTMKSLAEALARLLGTRIAHNRFDTSYGLIDKLRDDPAGRPLVIVLDEAQRLNRICAEHLRSLHGNPSTHWALVLAGGDGCWDVLSREAMLVSRIWEPVTFQLMEDEEVLEYLPHFHPMYSDVEPAMLLAINEAQCNGSFRRWSMFTARALELMDRLGIAQVTPELAALATKRPVCDFTHLRAR